MDILNYVVKDKIYLKVACSLVTNVKKIVFVMGDTFLCTLKKM